MTPTDLRGSDGPTFHPLMSRPGLILEGVEFVCGLLFIFLCNDLLQKGRIIFCEVLIPPCVCPMCSYRLNDRSSAENTENRGMMGTAMLFT